MKKILSVVAIIALIAVVSCVLFACVPSDLEKAEKKMKDAGYSVGAAIFSYEGVTGSFTATKASFSEGSGIMTALLFENKDSAKKAYDFFKGDKEKEDTFVKQNGKWVYIGSEAAIKAFEK